MARDTVLKQCTSPAEEAWGELSAGCELFDARPSRTMAS